MSELHTTYYILIIMTAWVNYIQHIIYKSNYTHPRWPHRLTSVTSLWGCGHQNCCLVTGVIYPINCHAVLSFDTSSYIQTICRNQVLSCVLTLMYILVVVFRRVLNNDHPMRPTVLDLDIYNFFLKISEFALSVMFMHIVHICQGT